MGATPAPYIRERRWSTEQSLTAQEDGGVILELAARSEAELTSWVLSFGTHAELISPQHLRQQIVQELGKAKELYR
ncbi:WYL domain-containing protein [Nitratidesulfovibrio vulgaris]|uniref:Conserved domain protein n=1 Tax=Nitratidesulfovibrio vulgaris (strain ATCC 29579 / DSM 644 / CCUG 34227 / NCIMB 8303 / VKM B-1760 / Hildenborough) TaxID=882 RepID=Q72AG7_NITV2|nr:WYL domain-containing protein [Nitratidesulfovibrio vulgaris]AAS96503.1 conserved domain protein [Nitratidesulfovibrio vulgaris str. Hildenborough]